jgi:NADH dehydrogenase FAD-containing subunit
MFLRPSRSIHSSNNLLRAASRTSQIPSSLTPAFPQILSRRYASTDTDIDASKGDRERVVILGSGWAGHVLSRTLNRKKFQTLVISPRSYFVFTPLLTDASVGTLEFRTATEPVRRRRSGIEFYQAWADDVDFANKKVRVESSITDPKVTQALASNRYVDEAGATQKKGYMFDIGYDKLVIATGCYSQTFGIKGVRENAMFLKDIGDARRIRRRILELFEIASLPATSEEMKKNLLHFAIVGGGPTGIEFAGNLSDLINDDLSKIHPGLQKYVKITVYDVAPKVLPMFDASLAKYAMDTFNRSGIEVKTSHRVEELRRGVPGEASTADEAPKGGCYTLRTKEEGEIGIGMCVWSTGIMMNPFVQKALDTVHKYPEASASIVTDGPSDHMPSVDKAWIIKRHPKSGAILVDNHLRVQLQTKPSSSKDEPSRAVMNDVFALGDTAVLDPGPALPATAQVANQEALWLGKRLNRGDLPSKSFGYRNLGIMAYLGGSKALFQSGGEHGLKGKLAFWFWRGAYLSMALSWRNRILMCVQWALVKLFGRDISRF